MSSVQNPAQPLGSASAQRQPPRSVVYSRLLLAVQACLWAMVVVPAVVVVAENLRWNIGGRAGWHAPVYAGVSAGAVLFMIGLSAASAYLAANLKPGRAGILRGVVALECFMGCFGVLVAYAAASTGAGIIAGLPVLAGLVGAVLSLAAAIGLLCKPARSFTASRELGLGGN